MSSDVNLSAIRQTGATAPRHAGGWAEEAAPPPPPGAGAPGGGPPAVNPSLRLDPALGLVVLEFRDETGQVTGSIPSQRQIEAYHRAGGQSVPGSQTTTSEA